MDEFKNYADVEGDETALGSSPFDDGISPKWAVAGMAVALIAIALLAVLLVVPKSSGGDRLAGGDDWGGESLSSDVMFDEFGTVDGSDSETEASVQQENSVEEDESSREDARDEAEAIPQEGSQEVEPVAVGNGGVDDVADGTTPTSDARFDESVDGRDVAVSSVAESVGSVSSTSGWSMPDEDVERMAEPAVQLLQLNEPEDWKGSTYTVEAVQDTDNGGRLVEGWVHSPLGRFGGAWFTVETDADGNALFAEVDGVSWTKSVAGEGVASSE